MKSRFALLAAMAVVALPLAAQGGQMRGGMLGQAPNIDTLTAQLSLTADQKPKVALAVTTYETTTKDAREFLAKASAGGDMASMRENPDFQRHMTTIREARTTMVTAIKAAITTEQGAKYDELYPQRGRRPGGE